MTAAAVHAERLALRLHDVEVMVGKLPRCHAAFAEGGKPKAAIPVHAVAKYLAAAVGQIVYRCGPHFHLATPRDVSGPPVKPAKIADVIQDARSRAIKSGMRMYVYGTRSPSGRWLYRCRPAMFRDRASRVGEL